MKKSNQSGFAAVEALLIVVILAIVGGTGYFVWHAKQNTDKSLTDTASSQPAIQKKTTAKVTDFASCKAASGSKMLETYPEQCVTKDGKTFTDTSASSQKYLVIKEWGVKLPLTATIDSAYYVFKNDYVYLSTSTFKGTQCDADGVSEGVLSRFTPNQTDPDTGSTYQAEGATAQATKVGAYYYSYRGPQAACADDSATQDKADSIRQGFVAAAKKLQAE